MGFNGYWGKVMKRIWPNFFPIVGLNKEAPPRDEQTIPIISEKQLVS